MVAVHFFSFSEMFREREGEGTPRRAFLLLKSLKMDNVAGSGGEGKPEEVMFL